MIIGEQHNMIIFSGKQIKSFNDEVDFNTSIYYIADMINNNQYSIVKSNNASQYNSS